MAGIIQPDVAGKPYRFNAAHTNHEWALGDAFPGYIGGFSISVQKYGLATISFIPKARPIGSGLTGGRLTSVPYQELSQASINIASNTAATRDGIYLVRCDYGMEIVLDVTTTTHTTPASDYVDVYITMGGG